MTKEFVWKYFSQIAHIYHDFEVAVIAVPRYIVNLLFALGMWRHSESECCRIPTFFCKSKNPTDFHTYSDLDSAFVLESLHSWFVAINR